MGRLDARCGCVEGIFLLDSKNFVDLYDIPCTGIAGDGVFVNSIENRLASLEVCINISRNVLVQCPHPV